MGKLFIISAPSGAGKTSLVHAIMDRVSPRHPLKRLITYTSRAPRANDINGIDYHFVSPQDFERKIAEGFFMEWSNVYGAYYGSPRSALDEIQEGISYIAILDRAGTRQIVDKTTVAVPIWITPPTLAILEERLRNRNTETIGQIERRLWLAKQEMEEEQCQLFYPHHVVNDEFEKAVADLEALILAEISRY
jgi:guanylate kinase